MEVAILGAGAMGSALAIPISERGHEIKLWFTEYDMSIYDVVSKGEPHPRIKVRLPDTIKFYKPDQLKEALEEIDYIIIAVSSEGVPVISKLIRETIGTPRQPLIVVSKGIEIEDGIAKTMSEIIEGYVGSDKIVYVAGPSLAAELAKKLPTHVVYASKYIEISSELKREFETSYYRIEVSNDIIGAQLSAALKNIYAIAYGIIEGYLRANNIVNNNLKAALLSKALDEMAKVVSFCGGKRETVYGLAGLGDLYVTSLGGRNSMFGQLLGEGLSTKEALDVMRKKGVGVVEGYKNAATIRKYLHQKDIGRDKAPIFYAVYSILYEGSEKEILFKTLNQ
ncbi:MAG: glycerol-3-phosphate dehydrogenase [Thermoprotei archaeon]|nr:MAG: glycerol-3-phosphate dehydrogenase [Thermoprotei archaeon]